MPYIKDGIKYDRMTEVCSAWDCEAVSYINKTQPINRTKKINISSLQGTLTHNKIANNEMTFLPIAYKELHLELDDQDKILLAKLIGDHRKQKKIEQGNPQFFGTYTPDEKATRYERMNSAITEFFLNYASFVADYPHKPLFIEEKKFWEKEKIAGTVDLIFETEMRGYVATLNLHPELGPHKYFVADSQNVNSRIFKVATFLDWKTSSQKQTGHRIQMSGYHRMWEDLGLLDELRKRGYVINSEGWSVLLGHRSRIPKYEHDPKPYQLFKYSCDSTDFLWCNGVRKNPRPITLDHKGKEGLKPKCMVCGDIMYCPDNLLTPSYPRFDNFAPLVDFNLLELGMLMPQAQEMKSERAQILKAKIDIMIAELMEQKNNLTDKEFLKYVESTEFHQLLPEVEVDETEST